MHLRLLLLPLALWVGTALAQEPGGIRGQVTDGVDQALPGSNVRVRGPTLPEGTGDVADVAGGYWVRNLPPGVYELTVSHVGFRTLLRSNIQVR